MLVSTRARYALRVMLDLALHEGYVPMKDVAQRQGISLNYLARIMPVLSKAGLVQGVTGKGGGYRLTRAPEDYTVGELLRLTEEDLAPVACLECDAAPCERAADCLTRPMWREASRLLTEYFDRVTLASLLKPQQP